MIVSQIFLDAFHELKMAYPKTTEKRRQEFIALGAANFAAGVTGEWLIVQRVYFFRLR